MSLAQDLFVMFVQHVWNFGKEVRENKRIAAMTPAEHKAWRAKQFAEIQARAVRLTKLLSESDLRRLSTTRESEKRNYEILFLHDLGVRTSQYLLEGEDIRGLDMRRTKGLVQDQINHAFGDSTTRLPDYLLTPPPWFLNPHVPGAASSTEGATKNTTRETKQRPGAA
jgi:hypothetical protein